MKILSKIAAAALLYSAAASAVEVTVDSYGSTFEEAKRGAFRQAIERATGVLTISEQEISGYQLTRDYVGSYSSGWINRYEVIEAGQEANGRWYVKMTADVRDSKIKMHSARRNTTNGSMVNGDLESTRLSTQLDQRSRGDQLLVTVLRSYPQHAYVINNGNTEFSINRVRQPYVDIKYNISMSTDWIDALKAALDAVAVDQNTCSLSTVRLVDALKKDRDRSVQKTVEKICGAEPDLVVFSQNSKDWEPKARSYYLSDLQTLTLINSYLRPAQGNQHFGLVIEFLNGNGAPVSQWCQRVENRFFIDYMKPTGVYNYNQKGQHFRPNIMGSNRWSDSVRVPISVGELEEVAKIKLSIQMTC